MAALAVEAKREVFTFRDRKGNVAHTTIWADQLKFAGAANTAAQVNQLLLYFQQLGVDLYAMQAGDTKLLDDGATATIDAHGPWTVSAQLWAGAFNSTGDYQTAEDKAVFTFVDASGSLHRYQVANPLASMFYADQETVNTATTGGSAVAKQFVADMLNATYNGTAPSANVSLNTNLGGASSAQGIKLARFVGATRRRARMQRRVSIFTLAPSETEPAE